MHNTTEALLMLEELVEDKEIVREEMVSLDHALDSEAFGKLFTYIMAQLKLGWWSIQPIKNTSDGGRNRIH